MVNNFNDEDNEKVIYYIYYLIAQQNLKDCQGLHQEEGLTA